MAWDFAGVYALATALLCAAERHMHPLKAQPKDCSYDLSLVRSKVLQLLGQAV